MMGTDFYNKSILNGKTPEEARQSEQAKRKQELLEVGQEALSQYFMLGTFSSFANNSSIGAPILNTLLSLIFRITSRVCRLGETQHLFFCNSLFIFIIKWQN